MDRLYYQPNHLWKGQKAVKKLSELSGEKPKTVKQWLSRQAFWQVHLPAPKRVDRPHYQVTTPRADYGKVQFSEWAHATNGHLQRKRYQNTVQVK